MFHTTKLRRYKMRHRNHTSKNSYINQQIKKGTPLQSKVFAANSKTTSAALEFQQDFKFSPSLTHQALLFIYLTYLTTSLLPVVAAEQSVSKNAKNLLDFDKKTAPKNCAVLCNTRVDINGHYLLFKCTPAARNEYLKNKQYLHDVSEIKGLMQTISKQPVVECKLDHLKKNDKRTGITLSTPKDLLYATAAASSLSMQIKLRANTTNDVSNLGTVRHELHHLFVSSTNKKKLINFSPSHQASTAVPYDEQNDAENSAWSIALMSGVDRLNNFMLNFESGVVDPQLTEAAQDYIPYEYVTKMKKSEFQRRKSLLKMVNPDLTLNEEYTKFIKEFELGLESYQIPFKYISVTIEDNLYAFNYMVDIDKKALAAIADAYILVTECMNNDRGNPFIEVDAYLHELFEPHTELFDLIFPELRQYHLNRASDDFKNCLKR